MPRGVPKAGKRQPRQPKLGLAQMPPAAALPPPEMGGMALKKGGKVAKKACGGEVSRYKIGGRLKKTKKF